MKSIAISNPNSSPAIRVNLLIIEHAPRIASKNSKKAVHTHTLPKHTLQRSCTIPKKKNPLPPQLCSKLPLAHHPVHAKNNFGPKSALSLTKLNMNVYISTVGSATPRIRRG